MLCYTSWFCHLINVSIAKSLDFPLLKLQAYKSRLLSQEKSVTARHSRCNIEFTFPKSDNRNTQRLCRKRNDLKSFNYLVE